MSKNSDKSAGFFLMVMSFVIGLIVPSMSSAQIEAGFLLNQKHLQLTASDKVFETKPVFRSRGDTVVTSDGDNSRIIKNAYDGVFLSALIGKTSYKGIDYEYPIDVVEAFVQHPNFATFAKTSFNEVKRIATSRTNCIHHPKTGAIMAYTGQQFNCTTVTPVLCQKLSGLKTEMKSPQFAEISKKIEQCKDALLFLGKAAKGVRDYINSDEFKAIATAKSEDLFELRKRKAKEFKLEVAEKAFLVPDQLNLFKTDEFKNINSKSGFEELGESLDGIKKLTMGCAALQSAQDELAAAILPEDPKNSKPTVPPIRTFN